MRQNGDWPRGFGSGFCVIDDVERIARLTGAMPSEVRKELAGAVRRSEPDAREVYGIVKG